jgi:hypothetical protein
MTLKRTELLVPVRLELVEPSLQRQHRFSLEAKDAQASIVRDTLVGHETRLEQDPQVPTHDGRGRSGGSRELPGAALPASEKLEYAPARGIGERREDVFHVISHRTNSYG